MRKVWSLCEKPPKRRHLGVERLLAGMAERRVAEIVGQRQRLGEILVEAERAGDGARDLRHFEAVGQPGAVMVALVIDEDLGLVLQAAERGRMDDAVAVALKRRAQSRAPARDGAARGSPPALTHRARDRPERRPDPTPRRRPRPSRCANQIEPDLSFRPSLSAPLAKTTGGRADGRTRRLPALARAGSGAVMPVVVPAMLRPDQRVRHLLLLRRQAGVKRLQCRDQTPVVIGAQLGELAAQGQALDRVRIGVLLAGGRDLLVERIGVLAHCRRDLPPLRLLGGRNLELGSQKGDPAIDQLPR